MKQKYDTEVFCINEKKSVKNHEENCLICECKKDVDKLHQPLECKTDL